MLPHPRWGVPQRGRHNLPMFDGGTGLPQSRAVDPQPLGDFTLVEPAHAFGELYVVLPCFHDEARRCGPSIVCGGTRYERY